MKKILTHESHYPVVQLLPGCDEVMEAETIYGTVQAHRLDVCGLDSRKAQAIASDTPAGELELRTLFPEGETGWRSQESSDHDTYVRVIFPNPENKSRPIDAHVKGFRISSLVEPASARPE